MQSVSALPSSIQGRRLFEDRKILQSSSSISPSMETPERSTAVTFVPTASFDSSLALILAAFLCSIVCVLGVSATIRCTLLCRRWRVVSEPGIDLGVEGVNGSTCREIDIKALPTTVYHTAGSPVAGIDCPICLSEFVEGEKVELKAMLIRLEDKVCKIGRAHYRNGYSRSWECADDREGSTALLQPVCWRSLRQKPIRKCSNIKD